MKMSIFKLKYYFFREHLRCKDIRNPKHQYQCQVLRKMALHPNEGFPEIDKKRILKILSPPEEMVKKAE